MKKLYQGIYTIILSSMVFGAFAQRSNVGIGTSKPDESAVLDINSTEKGLLMPRMTMEQRSAIQKPAKGLIVYQTDLLSGFYYFDGIDWKPMTSQTSSNSVAGIDGDWALTGNASGANAATSSSFIGTPTNIPINFKIGSVASGKIDGTTTRSTFVGYSSGVSSTGLDNVGVGFNALKANTTGVGNMGVGSFAMLKNQTGKYNVAVGASAMQENVAGDNNVAFGLGALRSALGSNNIGIGITAGFSATGSSNVFIGYQAGYSETGSNKLYVANTNTTTPLIYGNFSAKFISIGDVPIAKRDAIASAGSYGLLVKGGILTEKVKVALASQSDWADYVFEPNYERMSLEKVEEFVKLNKHLPNVPSAEEMAKEGLDVTKTSAKLMEKIEELTLYMIELNKEVKALKAENAALKKVMNK